MDPSKERKAEVLDFQGQIKKVTVVVFFNENQAGGKAVARQKARLGLSPEEKMPAPFKVILFQKNLKKKMICILCDINSYEEVRKGERLENFLHPENEMDSNVQCKCCRKFQCRICLQKLHKMGLGQHPDFGHLDDYLSKPPPHMATVPSCSCCSLKENIEKPIAMFKSTCLEEYHQQWDGMLWFPEYGLVVLSCLGTFNLHALAQLSPKEVGILHGLVSPEMAINLEDAGIKANRKIEALACSTLTAAVMCK